MARVRHPNVVTVCGAERIAGRVGLWMGCLEGQTLADELRFGGPFNEAALIELLRALCGALVAVHEAGLLHHDLKAQNVIRTTAVQIERRELGETFKLVDAARVSEVPLGSARGLVKQMATLEWLCRWAAPGWAISWQV